MRTTLAAPRNLAAEDNGRAATACHDRGVASGATVNATCDGSSDSATTSWSRRANMARSAGDLFHPLLRVCTAYQPTNAVLTLNLHALFWQKLANPRGVQQASTSLLAQPCLGSSCRCSSARFHRSSSLREDGSAPSWTEPKPRRRLSIPTEPRPLCYCSGARWRTARRPSSSSSARCAALPTMRRFASSARRHSTL